MPTVLELQRFPGRTTPLRQAFTLLELLVVIGIILILIGILLPAIKHVKIAGYSANTKNEISQISSACERYHEAFGDYPGPLSNTDIESAYPPISAANYVIFDSSHNAKITQPVSSSQNLVLGLCGGLFNNNGVITFVNSSVTYYPNGAAANATSLIGQGPSDLSVVQNAAMAQAPKQYTSFIQGNYPGSNLLAPGMYFSGKGNLSFTDTAGRSANDSMIPVFVDQFSDPMPILYIRARKGALGILSGYSASGSNTLINDPTTGASAYYSYDIRELAPYTQSSIYLTNPAKPHNLGGVGTFVFPQGAPPVPDIVNNGGNYFFNATITPTNTTTSDYINKTGIARQQNGFMLIAAGQDRRYGTVDDETSFGSVGGQ